jgi:hypothetical protein
LAKKKPGQKEIKSFLKDVSAVFAVPTPKKYPELLVDELPFDLQLLNASSVYRKSRKLYLSLGGQYKPSICSTMRGLSTQDLFKDEIHYSPSLSEWIWFKDFGHSMSDAHEEMTALSRFSEISIFHEQNHRIIWRLLPPAPGVDDRSDLFRYYNFAESLVVVLDLVFADQIGRKLSQNLENLKMIYRPGGVDPLGLGYQSAKADYRKYLMALVASTYFVLDRMYSKDVLKALDYVLPGQKAVNKYAVKRGLELSEIFTEVTNPQWQSIYWKSGAEKLRKIQNLNEAPLYLPEDPLDLEEEFAIAKSVFEEFGV